MREVFSLLRQTLGSSLSSREILNFADAALAFFSQQVQLANEFEDVDSLDERGFPRDGHGFEEWPVDVAMGDGGWRICEYEYSRLRVDQMEFGQLMDAEDPMVFHFPAGTLYGDLVPAMPMQWLASNKRAGQLQAASGWAIDEPGVHFYETDFDDW